MPATESPADGPGRVLHASDRFTAHPIRRWSAAAGLALVLCCFCVPLFVGLRNVDVGNDEAIYSYAVLRILETGDWLTPRAIPFDGPFLEKPPLKFWLVAAPIAAGLLPADELGLRAVDALLGSIAFVYVFLLGRWQSGTIGGVAAVLVLFTTDSIVFFHGLRSNNMEASILLCYVGGLYHFLRWLDAASIGGGARHRWATGAYFVLGFMTKFVAILFLPLICLAAMLLRGDRRAWIASAWRWWLPPAAVAVGLIAPWFVYQTVVSGRAVWDIMFLQHVYTRFTGALDVHHLQPWYFYATAIWGELSRVGSIWIVLAGLAALVVAAVRGDWLARVFLTWGIVPIALLSIGSSKLFHYIYPFLPPLALGAGYLASLVFDAITAAADRFVAPWLAWLTRGPRHGVLRALRGILVAAAAVAAIIGLLTAVQGDVSWRLADVLVLRNASPVRAFAMSAALLCLAGRLSWAAGAVATAILMLILPVDAYPRMLARANTVDRPLHATQACIRALRQSGAIAKPNVYDAARGLTIHEYNFYLRDLEPWLRADRADQAELRRRLREPGQQSPIILSDRDYRDVALRVAADTTDPDGAMPIVGFIADPGLVVLLPGPFLPCAADAAQAGGTPVGFAVDPRQAR